MLHYIETIVVDNNGNLWCGLADGLAKWNGVYWEPFVVSNSALPANSITSVAVANNGDKWIGTQFAGAVNVRSNKTSSISDNVKLFDLSVLPNPSDGHLNIRFDQTGNDVTLKVVDLLGNEVYFNQENNISGAYNRSLDLNFLPKGIYLLQLESGNAVTQRKISIF